MKIQSIDKTIAELLSSYFYRIPTFQRPYSWDSENIEEFWSDVVTEGLPNYFIGSMVVFKYPDNFFGIIDGQQRLTTITMILCALRNSLKEEGYDALAGALQQYVERIDVNAKLQYILQTETSYPYFQEYIQKASPPILKPEIGEEERKLNTAFRRVTSYIKQAIDLIKVDGSITEDERRIQVSSKLTEIRDRILQLKVIFIDLDNEEDAFIAFETLNTRGKDLEVSDLVKSYLLRLLKPQNINVDTAKERWDAIVANIEASDQKVNDFLHDYWVSQFEYVSVKNLYKPIKKLINTNNADDFLNDLLDVSRIYRIIYDTSSRKWEHHEYGIKASLEALKTFRVKQHLPIMIAILRDYEKGNLKKKRNCIHHKPTRLSN